MTPSAPVADRPAFLAAVQASGLLSPALFAKATAALPPDARTAEAAARFLTATGFLTRFQADRLLAGRADGFVIGPYVIQEQVGRGAMGRVYKAKHRTMNRAVAVKVLNADVTRTATAREGFQREVRAAAKLNHPNIVTAYDANALGDRFYLVLEFVDGPNLDTLARARGPLPVGEACEIIRQVACGLQHAHEQGMVHRDIKPANLLAAKPSRSLPGCVVKIADFGIARVAPPSEGVAAVGQNGILGTPDFIAPEQARDPRTADHRADLYSLGCVFYFLLAGRPPYPVGTAAEKVRWHQTEYPVPVNHLRPDVPPVVAEVVGRLLAKDPNARYQTAAQVATRLNALSATAVAGEEKSGVVCFDLPKAQPGPYSFGTGLTGMNPIPAAETSPWAQLTEDPTQATTGTIPPDLTITPVAVRKRSRTEPASRGVSVWTLAAVCGVAFLAVVAIGGLILRAAGR